MLAPTDNLFPDASAIPLEPSHIALPSADAAPEYTVLPLANLTVDTRVQPRTGGVDPDHVRMLIEVFDQLSPIVAGHCEDRLVVIDGVHTLPAAEGQRTEILIVNSPGARSASSERSVVGGRGR